jgi:endonuclease YncB( thermonuclease family)
MTPSPDYTYKAELLRVVDGDTIEVRIDLGFSCWHVCTLRLDGVDTPERNQPGWREATLATLDYCGTAGGELIVRTRPEPKKRQDSFRRYLAKVWAPDVLVGMRVELGEFLLSQHHATIWTKGGDK